MKDVVTFGETMVLFNPDSSGPLKHVHNFRKSIAGAESNVAIALARLGHDVGWFSRLGNDEFGKYINFIIRGEGIDVSKVTYDDKYQTGILFKERYMFANPSVYYYRKDSASSHLTIDDIDEEYIKNAKILHITGITLALSQSAQKAVFKAIEIAKKNDTLVSFDPNIRLKLWTIEEAKPVILKVAEMADILLPGEDEANLLIGTDDPIKIVDYFSKYGNKTIAIKLGKDGCYVSNASKGKYIQGFKIDHVKDTVGAGDGFAAGFLSGIIKGLSLEESGRLGNAIGAITTLVEGDMEGYPTEDQVKIFMGDKVNTER